MKHTLLRFGVSGIRHTSVCQKWYIVDREGWICCWLWNTGTCMYTRHDTYTNSGWSFYGENWVENQLYSRLMINLSKLVILWWIWIWMLWNDFLYFGWLLLCYLKENVWVDWCFIVNLSFLNLVTILCGKQLCFSMQQHRHWYRLCISQSCDYFMWCGLAFIVMEQLCFSM